MTDQLPILIMISGPPAAGKTTLARPLAKLLGIPLFEKDAIKERLADALGDDARQFRKPLGHASMMELYAIAEECIRAGQNAILEGFFHHGLAEPELAPIAARARAVLVHISADDDVLISRYQARADSHERHAIHDTGGQPGMNRDYLAEGRYHPLDLDVPTIFIDTTYGPIDVEEVAHMIDETINIS